MVTTANTELADKIRCPRDHGATMSDLQRHLGSNPSFSRSSRGGFNQRTDDIKPLWALHKWKEQTYCQ